MKSEEWINFELNEARARVSSLEKQLKQRKQLSESKITCSLKQDFQNLKSELKSFKTTFTFQLPLKADVEIDFDPYLKDFISLSPGEDVLDSYFEDYNPTIRVDPNGINRNGLSRRQATIINSIIADLDICQDILGFMPKEDHKELNAMVKKITSFSMKLDEAGLDIKDIE